jgi:hypothetical protein
MAIYNRMTIKGRGGALPTYQSQQAPYVPGQGINARVSGADAKILARGYNMEAKAMEGLVKAGKNAVDVGLQAANDYAKTKATELVTQYKMGMRQSMYGKDGPFFIDLQESVSARRIKERCALGHDQSDTVGEYTCCFGMLDAKVLHQSVARSVKPDAQDVGIFGNARHFDDLLIRQAVIAFDFDLCQTEI